MRVTHVITRLIVGGAQENTIATVLGLRKIPGIEADLISGPTTGPEGSLEHRVRQPPGLLSVLPDLVRPVSLWRDGKALAALRRHFQQTRPDIVHTHSGKAGILGRLAAAQAGVPIVVHSIHGPSFGEFQGRAANAVFKAAERAAGKRTTHFISVAQAMTDQYLRAGIGNPSQYTRIFSGFRLDAFLEARNSPETRAKWGLRENDFVIGKIARLFQLKGHDDLFAAAPAIVAQCPRARFLLVGGGEWRERFEAMAKSMGLERHFVFTGLVPPEEVPALVGVMDMLAHLSRREGLPRALPQALAAGKPVIAADCDGAREVCLDGKTGFLIAPGDAGALAERASRLCHSEPLRRALGEAGRSFVRREFSEELMVGRIHELYKTLRQA